MILAHKDLLGATQAPLARPARLVPPARRETPEPADQQGRLVPLVRKEILVRQAHRAVWDQKAPQATLDPQASRVFVGASDLRVPRVIPDRQARQVTQVTLGRQDLAAPRATRARKAIRATRVPRASRDFKARQGQTVPKVLLETLAPRATLATLDRKADQARASSISAS